MVRTQRTTRRARPVTRAEIFGVALRIVDEEGLDALSMRRIAREMGVEAMSLYHHVPNKEAILDGVADAVQRQMRLPDPMPSGWADMLVEISDAFRIALVSHPNVLPLVMTRPLTPPEDAMVTPVSILESHGMDPQRLMPMYQSVMALTFGQALITAANKDAGTPPLDDAGFRKAARFLIEGFAADEHPKS